MRDIKLLDELGQIQLDFEQELVVREAQRILHNEHHEEHSIAKRLRSKKGLPKDISASNLLNESLSFDIESIERICTKYRLRFLESELFKGEIPAEAIREVKRIESFAGIQFQRFMIIAPQERFELKDSTKDPILLAELPNGKYYYIFQWGDDLSWFQHILKYPFRHMGTLAATSTALGLLVALIVPSQFEGMQAEFFYRFFMFSMTSCLVMTLAIIAGIMNSKDFSENVWNSKFIR